MKKTICLAVLAALAAAPVWAAKEKFKVMHVSDLAAAMRSATPPVVCDANTKGVREQDGVIPGARLLSSSKRYSVAKELPSDKRTPLVFYCANTMCMASHAAAEKAMRAGFQDVAVMVDGIQGWVKAGQKAERLKDRAPTK